MCKPGERIVIDGVLGWGAGKERALSCLTEDDRKNCDARAFLEERAILANLLPEREKALFRMYYELEMTYAAIGRVCRCDEVTICRRLEKINEMLDAISRDVREDEYEQVR